MKSFLRSKKALSAVLATLLLIVVAVAAIVVTYAWVMSYMVVLPALRLDLQVSPLGYPETGASWSLIVFKINLSEGHPMYRYAENATIIVDILTITKKTETYMLLTDGEGRTSFQYLEKHSEVSFQAFLEGYEPSNKIVLNRFYVPLSTLTWLSTFSISSIGLALSGKKYLGKKRKSFLIELLNWTLLCILCLSSFVLVLTIYSFLFKSTFWGFPSEIVAPIITFEVLKYSAFITVILYTMVAFLIYFSYDKKN